MAEDLIALSFRQPWLWSIFDLGKDVENRVWFTKYRGPILLHAAKSLPLNELESSYAAIRSMSGREDLPILGVPGSGSRLRVDRESARALREFKSTLQLGGIVGRAHLGEPYPPFLPLELSWDPRKRAFASDGKSVAECLPSSSRWHMGEQYGYCLTQVERLYDAAGKPAMIPYTGALGLFRVPSVVITSREDLHFGPAQAA